MHLLRGITAVAFFMLSIDTGHASPGIPWHKFTEFSATLNQRAQHIARHVLGNSPFVHLRTDDNIVTITSDICSPINLKTDYKPCLQKIDTALKKYSSVFGEGGLFQKSELEQSAQRAAEAASELQELLHSTVLHDRNPATAKQAASAKSAWMRDDLLRHSAQNLLSFSILAARVFGAGDPATHGNASGGSCTRG